MECIKKINVELSGEMLFEYITAIQGDTASRYVEIVLLNNNQAYTPPDGATAVIRATKPDGTIILNNCEIGTGGTIKTELTAQMLAVCGNVRCQTSLYSSDGGILTSVPFIIKVVSKSANDAQIESGNEFNAIKEASDLATAASEIASEALEKVGEIEESVGAGAYVYDWKQTNAAFFNAIAVERNVMFLILTLIILVAAFNIITGLIMLVKDKGRDIAVLRTMGATRGMIMRIFFMDGAFIGVVGTSIGLALGLLFCKNIEAIRRFLENISGQELFSAEIYFLSQLPAKVDPTEVGVVVGISLLLSFLATIYPAYRAAKFDPVEALRYE